jgi:hypothetical protein
MPIWKSGPLLDVAVLIVAETVTQLNFMLNYGLWTFQSFLVHIYQLYTATRHYVLSNMDWFSTIHPCQVF